MKKVLAFIIFVLSVSCGPSRHAIHVEMRHPSKSGLELGGKIVSVVYSGIGDKVTDTFNKDMADSATGETSQVANHSFFQLAGSPKSQDFLGTKNPFLAAITLTAIEIKAPIKEANS